LCSIGKVNISLSAYVADCSWTDVDSALNKLFTQATAESADCKNKTTIAAKHKISFACWCENDIKTNRATGFYANTKYVLL